MGENIDEALARIQEAEIRWQVTFVTAVVSFGMVWGIFDVFLDRQIPFVRNVIVATLLFGIIEIPRLRSISEGVRFLLMGALTTNAIIFIHLESPGVLGAASSVAIIMLFISSAVVALIIEGIGDTPVSEDNLVTIADAPYYMVAGGVAALAIV